MPLFGPPDVKNFEAQGDIKRLVKALCHRGSPRVRRQAAEALGRLGSPRAVEPLIVALRDREPEVRGAVAFALGQLGDARAVEPLIGVVKNDPSGWRSKAAAGLAELGDLRAVEPLIAVLEDRGQAAVHGVVGWALGRLGDPRAVQPLIGALGDFDWPLHDLHPDLVPNALAQIGAPAVGPLIEALNDNDPRVLRGAATALGQIGDARAVQPLLDALNDCDPAVRTAAASAVGQIADVCATEPLIAALGDSSVEVCEAAAEALGIVGDLRAIEPLKRALQQTDSVDVRVCGLRSLKEIREREAARSDQIGSLPVLLPAPASARAQRSGE